MKTINEYPKTTERERNKVHSDFTGKRHRKKKNYSYIVIVLCIILSGAIGAFLGYTIAARNIDTAGGVAQGNQETVEIVQTEDVGVIANTPEPEHQSENAQTQTVSVPQIGESNDLIDVIAQARLNGMTKHCYLTFDDGPSSKVTGEVLDTLKKYDIKATFFEVGKNIHAYPDVAKRVYHEGHLIANHSYYHEYNQLYATEESFKSEIEKTEETIKEITGQQEVFKLVRFPGGSYNAGDHATEKQIYKQTLKNMGYFYCDWNTLNGDAEGVTKNSAQLVEFFKSSAAEFITQDKNVIVLMHDSDAKQPTADALESIILYLKDNGYTFHRLDDIDI
ncbi:MAG: polysaccharide deacetylase family protein [Hominilimicola sp.]